MDRTISASVGIGGGNRSADVKTIQEMLNKALPGWGGPMPKLATDGVCGNLTKSAIRRFQEVQLATYFSPDGRADPGGLTPSDIQTAILYDHFTPYVLMQLEEFGFCGRGEAKDFVTDGRLEVGGALPINTHGGQLGEAYIHGMNGIAEAVRQIRGTSVNQVGDVTNVLVTAGTGVPTSGLILSAPA